jgi:hypothetical protein
MIKKTLLAPNTSTSLQRTSAVDAYLVKGHRTKKGLSYTEQELEDQQFPKEEVRIGTEVNLIKEQCILRKMCNFNCSEALSITVITGRKKRLRQEIYQFLLDAFQFVGKSSCNLIPTTGAFSSLI